ncbi:c-type cytochrome [Piscinibacter sakaiensis]|uniref:c-type cytochrome n=1 Tax=Piscinibacter sakaiensis TaxID=1547922 RepID=UPI003AB029D5
MNDKTPAPAGRRRGRWLLWLAVLPTLLLIALGIYLVVLLNDDEPVVFADIVEHFKYGSTGGERAAGFPYWIFQALPQVCSEHLPGKGYASLGLIYEDGKDLPVGMSKRRLMGVDRTFMNCAVCHVSTVRETADAQPRLVVGMPANTFNLFGFQKFFFDCVRDPKFSTEFIVPEIARLQREQGDKLGLLDRYAIYPLATWIMRERLLTLAGRFGPMLEHTEWGPGRTDTFNPNKALFNFPLDRLPEREKHAAVDFPSIWLQQPRQGMQLHWDGNNVMAEERNKNAAFGTGTTPPTIDLAAIARLENWMLSVEPPAYPLPVEAAKAERGAKLYADYCAGCHGSNGRDFAAPAGNTARECLDSGPSDAELYRPQVGRITPIDEIGTDRHRLDSYSWELAVQLGTIYAGYPHRYCHYRKTYGYANMPLDGLWLRAPYLHNGSVPTLRDLLEPASARPQRFYRGNDTLDAARVGFVSTVPAAGGRSFFLYDTSLPGNSNAGHEGAAYGTELAPDDKDALVEHLKTF